MQGMPYSQIKRGTLLIATPETESGIFFHSVVLVCEYSPAGSFGVIINKQLEEDLPEEIINVNNLANTGVSLRTGGPIQTNHMMILHSSEEHSKQSIRICDNIFLGGDLKFLQKVIGDPDGPKLNLCFGYTGWTMGQIEKEFLDGQWFLIPATEKYVFETPPDKLWQKILLDMGGKYAPLSMIPEDLSLN